MKFSPIKFQGALAAAGVSLMPFVYLQFSVPHGKGIVKLSDIIGQGLTSSPLTMFLLGIMLLFAALHFVLTFAYLKNMASWVLNREEYKTFMNNAQLNIGIFSPIISLSMSLNVILGPVVLFFNISQPAIHSMLPLIFVIWGLLWFALFFLEAKSIKGWFMFPIEAEKLNFGWLLDVFAFGMISLVGAGISAIPAGSKIASLSAVMTLAAISTGIFLFVMKLIILIYHQLKADKMPDKIFLPSYFVVVPILCLWGISMYKYNAYLRTRFSYDLQGLSYFIIMISFSGSVFCIFLFTYLLRDYYKNEFNKKEFYPSLWAPVCALVGFEVLGSYVYGNYYRSQVLLAACCLSTVLAAGLYITNLVKYYRYGK
ncbi:MAG: hypothetical protein A3J83_09220 [Elusimicrobia bacterium RIFOXYA2_FULL_40_6]|nr:MAG: hypothetical protein A3J83_09220 [Elusimicrobia bacterium RIFOXYA2_FULL_40_6]